MFISYFAHCYETYRQMRKISWLESAPGHFVNSSSPESQECCILYYFMF